MTEQEEYLYLVQKLAKKYTSNESSSIRYETAASLLEAIRYCIQEYESAQINEISRSETTIEQIYEAGYQHVLEKTKETKIFHDNLTRSFQLYGNEAYEKTVMDGMQQFFLYYNPKFKPMDHLLTLDYPTLSDYEKLTGIDLIYRYLYDIAIEQHLLQQFPYEYVNAVLAAYASDYKELIINIPNIILINVAGSLMIKKPLLQYGYEPGQYERIYELLSMIDDKNPFFHDLFDRLFNSLSIPTENRSYFEPVICELLARIEPAMKHHHIDKLFLL